MVSSWIDKLAGKGRRGGNGVLVQIAREVVGRRRSVQGAISEVRHPAVLDALSDDLNTPLALTRLMALDDPAAVKASAALLGLLQRSADDWFQAGGDADAIESRIAKRAQAKKQRDFATADRIRDELKAEGIVLEDTASGTTWRRE